MSKLLCLLAPCLSALAVWHSPALRAQGPLPPPVAPAPDPSTAPVAQPAPPAPGAITGRAATAAAGGYENTVDAPSSGIGKFFHRIGKDVKMGFKEGEANSRLNPPK